MIGGSVSFGLNSYDTHSTTVDRVNWTTLRRCIWKTSGQSEASIYWACKVSNDPLEISNIFNNYFSWVGENLASRVSRSSRNFTEYWPPYYNPSSSFFDPVSPAEIQREILLMPKNKTYGLYSCPVRILTDARCVISGLRSIIMTKSVQKGVFPSKLKKAEVVHVYKNDDKPEPGNCRSISLLSISNRIFEKLK